MHFLPIATRIDGRDHTRDEVFAWEAKRARKAARRLRVAEPSADPAALLGRVVDRKLALGHDALRRLFMRDLRVSAPVGQLGATVSRGRRKVATTTLACETGAAELVPAWYSERFAAGDEVAMLAASPDHWLFDARGGVEEVIETTGGAPAAVQMFFDHDAASPIQTPHDPAFPVDWVAIARNARGTPIGGVRHQFLDRPDGFEVRLNVEFPVTTLPSMITAHCWHLACEFSNWIEFANGVRDPHGRGT